MGGARGVGRLKCSELNGGAKRNLQIPMRWIILDYPPSEQWICSSSKMAFPTPAKWPLFFLLLASLAVPSACARGTFDVTKFGAVGNGVEDDTVAIQKAINASFGNFSALFFPAGALDSAKNFSFTSFLSPCRHVSHL